MAEVTVGLDIGTTSVKAVAATADGAVVARARVPHEVVVDRADHLAHRPDQAWRAGVVQALAEAATGHDVLAVNVSAMVPSLCAVDGTGRALTDGLLYGDSRGADPAGVSGADPSQSGEIAGFARWCAARSPDAAGIWPAQAVANHALGGEPVIDGATAMTIMPLFDGSGWDEEVAAGVGVDVAQLPRVVFGDQPAGTVTGTGPGSDGAVLGAGTVDALAEQVVAGADRDGDVLVIMGTTLICWAVIPEWREADGLWTIPHTAPGKCLIGGPSNAGGLFVDWVRRLTGAGADGDAEGLHPDRVPVSVPYIRGERVPVHDPHRRAAIHDIDLTHGPAAVVRSAHEASGFVIRHHLDLAELQPQRIVATGGGVRAPGWVEAIADVTALPVDVVAVPEGAALGSAFLARVAAGLEPSAADASRWARTARRVDPDPAWVTAADDRYRRFRDLA